jgi:hypothetical protein
MSDTDRLSEWCDELEELEATRVQIVYDGTSVGTVKTAGLSGEDLCEKILKRIGYISRDRKAGWMLYAKAAKVTVSSYRNEAKESVAENDISAMKMMVEFVQNQSLQAIAEQRRNSETAREQMKEIGQFQKQFLHGLRDLQSQNMKLAKRLESTTTTNYKAEMKLQEQKDEQEINKMLIQHLGTVAEPIAALVQFKLAEMLAASAPSTDAEEVPPPSKETFNAEDLN